MSGSATYTVTLNASASFSNNDAPIYEILVNGTIEATGTITSNNVESQTYAVSALAGQPNVISIAYINHTSSSQLLSVQSVDINGVAVSTSTPGEDYVSANGTYDQWGQMYFGGQINIPVPAADFPGTGSGSSGGGSSGGGSSGGGSSGGSSGTGSGGGATTPVAGTTPYTIGVQADASFNSTNYPIFDLLVDGQQIGSGTVNSNNVENFTFAANLVAGQTHDVQVVYTNHKSSAELLNVQSISVGGQTISSGSVGETYRSTNGVQQQTGQMYFGGTLDFQLPAADFAGPPVTTPPVTTPPVTTPPVTTPPVTTPPVTTPPVTTPPVTTPPVTTPPVTTPPVMTPPVTGSAVYVATTGSDSNNGSLAHPFATLAGAIHAAETDGIHTVYVEAGTYAVASTVQLGSADNGDSILAAAGAAPVLNATGGNSALLQLNGATGVTISGLTFANAAGGSQTAALTLNGASGNTISGNTFVNDAEGALFAGGSSKNLFTENQLNNSGNSGVEVKDGSNSNTFSNNTLNGVNSNDVSGAAFYGHGISNDVFANNLVENTAGAGIAIEDYGLGTTLNSGNTITANELINTSTSSASTDDGAIYLLGRSDNNLETTVSMNFISGAGNVNPNAHVEGIYLDDNASGVTVTNNIVQGVQSDDVELHGGYDVSITNNIFNLGTATRTVALIQQPEADRPATAQAGLTGDNISGNIVTSQQANPLYTYVYFDPQSVNLPISNNLYWDPLIPAGGLADTYGIYFNPNTPAGDLPMVPPVADSSPVVGNPNFVGSGSGNYALGPNSAALKIGFVPINQSLIGPH